VEVRLSASSQRRSSRLVTVSGAAASLFFPNDAETLRLFGGFTLMPAAPLSAQTGQR
jgi:hypothetical protein